MNNDATSKLNALKRISPLQINSEYSEKVLLCPPGVTLEYLENNRIHTIGLGDLDKKDRDLIRKIHIIDTLSMQYNISNIVMLRTYAESLSSIPEHVSVQAIILSKVDNSSIRPLSELIKTVKYTSNSYDNIWIEKDSFEPSLLEDQYVYVMNRRIGGWDGSREYPVIELLGAGGHLPDVWNDEYQDFITMEKKHHLTNELQEELGLSINEDEISFLGGFHNKTSNELVILACCFINSTLIPQIFEKSSNNVSEDTDGIYLGRFTQVIERYLEDATNFAGGEKTKSSNFPSQTELMKEVYKKLNVM